MTTRLVFVFVLLLTAVPGCISYREQPLTDVAVHDKLSALNMDVLKVEAEQIKHPILRPVEIDEEDGLTPDEAAILAVLLNPGLRAERDKKGVSAAQLYQAGILPNPRFSAGFDFPAAGTTGGEVIAYGLGLEYDLQSLITRGAEVNAARFHGTSVALDVAWQEWQVAESAKLHAYRLFLLEKQLELAQSEEKGLKENRDAVRRAVDYGDITIMDLSAAQASLEKVHLSVLGIQQDLAKERLALRRSVGFEPTRPLRLSRDIELPKMVRIPPLEDLTDEIADRRLDLVALKMGYQSQEERLRAAILGQFPKITIGTSRARDTGNVITHGFSIGIELPFFDRNQGPIALEKATRERLFDEYIARLFEAQSDVAEFRADMVSISRQIKATESYLPAQNELVGTYYEAMLQGNADALTYYNARDELIATRISLLSLQVRLVDRFVALEIASGAYLWQTQCEGQ